MSEIPMLYRTGYQWQGRSAEGAISIDGGPALDVGSPHDTDRFCPEQLLVATAESCLANYILLIAELSNVTVSAYRSQAEGELEQDDKRRYRFRRILIRPELTVEGASESAVLKIIDKAHGLCLVARSLNCPVEVEATIHA